MMDEKRSKQQSLFSTRNSTLFFRAANFELFVKPVSLGFWEKHHKTRFRLIKIYSFLQNKYVMTVGVISFSFCLFYLYSWNRKSRTNSDQQTYLAINEDESQTIRQRKSRWDWLNHKIQGNFFPLILDEVFRSVEEGYFLWRSWTKITILISYLCEKNNAILDHSHLLLMEKSLWVK